MPGKRKLDQNKELGDKRLEVTGLDQVTSQMAACEIISRPFSPTVVNGHSMFRDDVMITTNEQVGERKPNEEEMAALEKKAEETGISPDVLISIGEAPLVCDVKSNSTTKMIKSFADELNTPYQKVENARAQNKKENSQGSNKPKFKLNPHAKPFYPDGQQPTSTLSFK
jgi:hypothetical protein